MNSLWERFLDKFSPNEANLKEFADNCWHLLANLVLAALVLIAFWIAGAMLRRFVLRIGGRARMNADVLVLLASTAKLVLLAIGLVTASGNLGIDVSALVAGLGLTGFAVGFAVKDIISNWLAGILILAVLAARFSKAALAAAISSTRLS